PPCRPATEHRCRSTTRGVTPPARRSRSAAELRRARYDAAPVLPATTEQEGARELLGPSRRRLRTAQRATSSVLPALVRRQPAQPAISQTKLDGLAAYYGIGSAAYFELHRELDAEHAAAARALIERRMTDADQDGLITTASAALEANWRLLDGVEAALA